MSLLRNHSLLTGNYHPFYKSILTRAISNGFGLPSRVCMGLQDKMLRAMINAVVWTKLDYFYVLATAGGATAFTGINWVQPSEPVANMAAAVFVDKKGLHTNGAGSVFLSHAYNNIISGMSANNACMMMMFGVGGGAWTQIEYGLLIQASGNYHTMRLRNNPRIDYLLNLTTASPQVLQAGMPVTQRLYVVDTTGAGGGHTTTWFNGVLQTDNTTGAGSGQPIGAGSVLITDITSGRAVAIIGGGASLYDTLNANKMVALNTAVQNYMNGINV